MYRLWELTLETETQEQAVSNSTQLEEWKCQSQLGELWIKEQNCSQDLKFAYALLSIYKFLEKEITPMNWQMWNTTEETKQNRYMVINSTFFSIITQFWMICLTQRFTQSSSITNSFIGKHQIRRFQLASTLKKPVFSNCLILQEQAGEWKHNGRLNMWANTFQDWLVS